MDDRQNSIITRIEQGLKDAGHDNKTIRECAESGFGDMPSFFELLVDLKLEGKKDPSPQEIWENMKKQINYLKVVITQAGDDYRKLENKARGLQADYNQLLREG
jgi:hypothetical protein